MSPPNEPKMVVPLDRWAEALIDAALEKHINQCPVRSRVERLELSWAKLVSFMAGSGFLGGIIGSIISKFA